MWRGWRRTRPKPRSTRSNIIHVARARDEQLLMLLHLREVDGLTFGQISMKMGITRDAALGAYRRIALAYDDWCECDKPENKDGGMPPLWWKGTT